MNATPINSVCIRRHIVRAQRVPAPAPSGNGPVFNNFIDDAGGAAPTLPDYDSCQEPPGPEDEPDVEFPSVNEPEPVFEHADDCDCDECRQKAIKRKLLREEEFIFHQNFPDAHFYGDSKCSLSHQVWSDLDLQLNHLHCYRQERRELLTTVYRKVNYDLADGSPGYWKRQKAWKNYDATASIVACSSYEKRHEFVNCGLNGFSCGNRSMCLRCSFNLLAKPTLAEFGNAFHEDSECHYIVLSLSRHRDETKRLIFKDLTKSQMVEIKNNGTLEQAQLDSYGIEFKEPTEVYESQVYWELFGEAIRGFVGNNRPLSGAFGGPELSVRFFPLGALPHANYIAWSPHLDSDDARKLRRLIRDKMRACRRISPGLYPKVAVYRIMSKADLRCVIRYIFKAINFLRPYIEAAKKLLGDPESMASLNRDADIFLENVTYAFWGTHRLVRLGICNPACKHYIGKVTTERRLRREFDAARRKEERKERKRIRKMFPDYKPHQRKPSEQERRDTFLMRVSYRKAVLGGELPEKYPTRWLRWSRAKKSAVNDTKSREPKNAITVACR